MTTPRALEHLGPRSLVEDAAALDLREFLERYGDAHVLLVRIADDDTDLELGLAAGSSTPGAGVPEPLPFRTVLQKSTRTWRFDSDQPRREDPAALWRLIEKDRYYAVSIRKRADADAFMGRISLGRARNKDIVLRHTSISKFHAWFETDDSGGLHVCDAGSTNLTHVNGIPIEARARTAVEPGAALRFGSVETVVTTRATLWASLGLHEAVPTPSALTE
jgi:hypothetical protein